MTYNIISFHQHYLDAAAELYAHAYGVPPSKDKDPVDISREVVAGQASREDFIGVLAVNESQEVVGLAWGYGTPTDNPRITRIVEKRMGKQWVEDTFMVEAFGMHLEHKTAQLARDLESGLLQRLQSEDYQRVRIRLNIPRLDSLPETLYEQGWRKLEGLSHVVWLGKYL